MSALRPRAVRSTPRRFDWQLHSTRLPSEPPLAWDGTDCGGACGCMVVPQPAGPERPRPAVPAAGTGSRS